MAQDKSSGLEFQVQHPAVRARARARADVPGPEITLGFSDSEAPTALVPKPLLNRLLRDTLPRESEPPLAALARQSPVTAVAAAPAPVPVVARAPMTAAPYTPPASLSTPSVPDAGPTVIVVPAAAEETERVQRRKDRRPARPSHFAPARVVAAALFVALVLGAVVWRSEVAGALRVLAHAVGIDVAE